MGSSRIRTAASMATVAAVMALASCSSSVSPEPTGGDAECGPFVEEEAVVSVADWLYYETLDEAFEASDLVIVGEYLDSEVGLEYPLGDSVPDVPPIVTTFNDVRVVEVISGEAAAGDEIVVAQMGGCHDGIHYREAATVLLADIEAPQVVLFLTRFEDHPFNTINPTEGVMLVHGEEIEAPYTESELRNLTSLDQLREAADSPSSTG